MRLPVYPGRGGRGHPTLPTPKYLIEHKALCLQRAEKLKQNRFSLLDQTNDDFEHFNNPVEVSIKEENQCQKIGKNIGYKKKGIEIPNSIIQDNEPRTAPDIEIQKNEDTGEFTTVTHMRKKKKKYNTRSPKDFYEKQHTNLLEESNNRKFQKNVEDMMISQKMRPLSQKEDLIDIEMEEPEEEDKMQKERVEEDEVREKMWTQITNLCKDMELTTNIEKDDTIEMLQVAVTKLKSRRNRPQISESNGLEPLQEHKSVRKVVSPDGKQQLKKQKCEEEKNCEDEQMQSEEIIDVSNIEKCRNLLHIIKEVALTINYKISEKEEAAMKKWELQELRKKLGSINILKKAYAEKNTIIKTTNEHDNHAAFVRVNENATYDQSGLNVKAVSNVITPVKKNVESMYKPPAVESVERNEEVKAQMRHSYTARLRLAITDSNVNVGLMLKKMFKLWKDADSSVNLLAHKNEQDNSMMIDDVNKIPFDEEDVQKYIMPGMHQYDGKLHMSLRFSGHLDLPSLKKKIFTWMRRNNSFATIDRVQAALVHTIGFLHCIHPDYYNRENIKIQIKKCLEPLQLGDDVNVFARKIWMRYKGKKIETRALVLEVPKDSREEINAAMMEFRIENCGDMTYVPFAQVADEFYDTTMKEIFLSQNIYLHKTKSRTVYGVGEPNTEFTTKAGETLSFREWIETITFDDKFFLDACVVGPSGYLHLIYDEEYEYTVQKLFGKNFQEYAKDHFYEEDIKTIFSNSKITINRGRQTSKKDQEYADFLKRKFGANPQDMDAGIAKRDTKYKTYAEASKAPPQRKQRMNLHYSQFSEASGIQLNEQVKKTKVNHNKEKEQELQMVLQRLESLEKKKDEPEHTNQDWEEKLNEKLNNKMAVFQKNFEMQMKTLESKTENRMKKSEELIIGKLHEMQMNNTTNITNSFDSRMDEMGGKLDQYMRMFMEKLGSTGNTRHESDVSVVGKSK